MARKKNKRFAGDRLLGDGSTTPTDINASNQPGQGGQVQPKINKKLYDPVTGKRDYTMPNWDNPSKKEMRKFEKKSGYPQYLGGFREDYVKDMYQDKQIDYYANNKKYDKFINKIGNKTGLNFNRVFDQDQAEIVNIDDKGQRIDNIRTDKDLTNNQPGGHQSLSVPFEAFGSIQRKGGNVTGSHGGASGLSYAVNPKDYAALDSGFTNFNDMHQVNRTVDYTGEDLKNLEGKLGASYKGAQGYSPGMTDQQYNKQAKQMSGHTRRHEFGHSLGLAGDLTLTDKDPSLMSYNFDIRGGGFGKREYESIKKVFSPYT